MGVRLVSADDGRFSGASETISASCETSWLQDDIARARGRMKVKLSGEGKRGGPPLQDNLRRLSLSNGLTTGIRGRRKGSRKA